MAKLTRVTGKVFGSNTTATIGGIGQFGSAITGTPNLTTDVATIQALPAYLNGWGSAVITSRNYPPLEEVTGVLKTISYQACYVLQEGIPEYDINTEYSNTSIVKSINNGIITLYVSLANNNIGNSLTDTTKWQPVVLDLSIKADVDLANTTPAQSFIDKSVGWVAPDWANKASKTVDTTYTAESNGWIIGYYSTTSNVTLECVINGVVQYSMYIHGGAGGYRGAEFFLPVSKGDTYSSNYGTLYFVPVKGA